MEVYRRITERVRGALWAHHRRLMPERQFHRILAYVYNNKYEHQIRFDRMEVVGREWDGRVEVVTTPAGFLKRVRVNPELEDLTPARQRQLVLSAYSQACEQGRRLMEQAELNIYKQFLRDLKPVIMGIRDNPEFYTVPEGAVETVGGTLAAGGGAVERHRTIPAARAHGAAAAAAEREQWERAWLAGPYGARWGHTLQGKRYLAHHGPQFRPRGAPGAKRQAPAPELLAPYTPMDEARLLRRNWVAFLDNKHVAESLWTRAKVADREKQLRLLQEKGQAWHRPINPDATDRW